MWTLHNHFLFEILFGTIHVFASRDAEGDKIPLRLKELCEEIQPENSGDALCLVLHVLMVETGFAAQVNKQKRSP